MIARDMPDTRPLDIDTAYVCLAETGKHVFAVATEAVYIEDVANRYDTMAGSREPRGFSGTPHFILE